MKLSRRAILLVFVLGNGPVLAEPSPAQPSGGVSQRFPQPVRVGDLLHRVVLWPLASQPVAGHVVQVVRQADGTLQFVVASGGVLGFGTRLIAVSADAVALLGDSVEIVGLTAKQLDDLPTFTDADAVLVEPGETISVGLASPSH